jgi:hypothetical protein
MDLKLAGKKVLITGRAAASATAKALPRKGAGSCCRPDRSSTHESNIGEYEAGRRNPARLRTLERADFRQKTRGGRWRSTATTLPEACNRAKPQDVAEDILLSVWTILVAALLHLPWLRARALL